MFIAPPMNSRNHPVPAPPAVADQNVVAGVDGNVVASIDGLNFRYATSVISSVRCGSRQSHAPA